MCLIPRILVALGLVLVSSRQRLQVTAVSCPKGFSVGAQCFIKHENRKTWDDAQAVCKESGGFLAAPDSIPDFHKHEVINSSQVDGFWLGGSDREKEGEWKWSSDGASTDGALVGNSGSWASSEPSNGKGEDCLYLKKTVKLPLDDRVCSNSYNFVCEINHRGCKTNYHKLPNGRCVRCFEDSHCPSHEACRANHCANPCIAFCKSDVATCGVTNHQAVCTCPTEYKLEGPTVCKPDPAQFVVISSGETCFAVSHVKVTWEDADTWCQKHNSRLIQQEHGHLLQEPLNITNLIADSYWILNSKTNISWTKEGNVSTTQYGPESEIVKNKFICILNSCALPKIDGVPFLTNFSETSITVSLPVIETHEFQAAFLVVCHRSTSGFRPNPTIAEEVARQNVTSHREDLPWITQQLSQADLKQDKVIGNLTDLPPNNEYYVALVVATRQGNFSLYNSSEFGGPFYAIEYRVLHFTELLTGFAVTSGTIFLATGIYEIILRYRMDG